MNRTMLLRLSALALFASLGACSTTAVRGNITDPDAVAKIKVGQSRMEDVSGLLGTPSQVGTFDDKVWYYIGQRTERIAFLAPEVTERRVVVVVFDDKGLVTAVKTNDDPNSGTDVETVDRKTPTAGRELTFMEQLLGNVGRFSTKKNATGVTRGTGGDM